MKMWYLVFYDLSVLAHINSGVEGKIKEQGCKTNSKFIRIFLFRLTNKRHKKHALHFLISRSPREDFETVNGFLQFFPKLYNILLYI
jgi:hypothetical protein